MQYRTFGRLDWRPSALGFGVMRMPAQDNDNGRNPFGEIDEPKSAPMLRYAIDHGVNYVDSAYNYHEGTSETFLGQALQDGYRERVKLATKLPCWLIKETGDFDRYLGEQLERLRTDHVDFYLFHALRKDWWDNLRELKILEQAERAIADGRIRHLGFSFHDQYEVFEEIVDGYDGWTFCQIQYNYMDIDCQAGTKGLKHAADRGLAVVVMEPIRGGLLSKNVPSPIQELWDSAPRRRTPADWALQWVWNHPEVSVVLSGMSTMEQVQQNIVSASQSGAGTLSRDELDLVGRVREKYQELASANCTGCRYCQPCPNNIPIAYILELYNQAAMYKDLDGSRLAYSWLNGERQGSVCTQCEQCMELCPQQLDIPGELAKAHELLGQPSAQ